MKETYPEILVKIRHDDVILRQLTSFSYIFPYYDVIDKNADVSKNNDVVVKIIIVNKRTKVPLLPFIKMALIFFPFPQFQEKNKKMTKLNKKIYNKNKKMMDWTACISQMSHKMIILTLTNYGHY